MKTIFRLILFAVAVALVSAVILTACTGAGGGEETESGEPPQKSDAPLNVYCFKAGAADAFVFTTENGVAVLDTGKKGFGKEILSYLEGIGRDKIDYLIITHFDKDHVGGAAKVINTMPVGNVLQSNYVKITTEYEKYTKALKNAGISPVTVRETYEFELDGVKFSVDPPKNEEYVTDPSNNSSLIVSVECCAGRLLFAGDAENDRMADYIGDGLALDCALLKVPHHGKWDRNLKDFVAQTAPEYAVITSSDEEPEDDRTVSLLKTNGAEVFFTRTAPVVISCEGGAMTVAYDQ